jgi:hypothetical protein
MDARKAPYSKGNMSATAAARSASETNGKPPSTSVRIMDGSLGGVIDG